MWANITITAVIGAAVALGTLVMGVHGYFRQNKQNRAEYFTQMRRGFAEDKQFEAIRFMLATNPQDPMLAESTLPSRTNFVGFYEEIALMMNSGLISKEVTHYMFGFLLSGVGRVSLFGEIWVANIRLVRLTPTGQYSETSLTKWLN